MDKRSRIRRTLLAIAFLGTCAAIFYPVDDSVEFEVLAPTPVRPAPTPLVSASPAPQAEEGGAGWAPLIADPFAPRGWTAPPVEVAAPVVAAVTVGPEAPAPPPVAPALPYQFVGQLNDSAEHVVYLSRGEQALLARSGEVLEGTYKVVRIDNAQIEFEHMPTGQKQMLVFPAPTN